MLYKDKFVSKTQSQFPFPPQNKWKKEKRKRKSVQKRESLPIKHWPCFPARVGKWGLRIFVLLCFIYIYIYLFSSIYLEFNES